MSKSLNDNFKISAGKPVDSKYLNTSNAPYTGTSQVLSQIPLGERHVGLLVNVNNVEYWFKGGVANGNLLIRNVAGNGLTVAHGNHVVLGGALTGNTTLGGTTGTISLRLGGFGGSDELSSLVVRAKAVDILSSTSGITIQSGVGMNLNAASSIQIDSGVASSRLLFNTTTAEFLDRRATKRGIQYASDYSSGFTNFSLVTKGWVVNQLNGATGITTVFADNGLTKQGSFIRLGGTLTGTTTIDANNNNFIVKLSTRPSKAVFIRGDIGSNLNIPLFLLKNNTGSTLSAGLTDIVIGPHTGGTFTTGTTAGNISIGVRNFNNILSSVTEFNGGRNIGIGFENHFTNTGGTHHVLIGRQVQRNATFLAGNGAINGYNIGIGYEVLKNAVNLDQGNIVLGQSAAKGIKTPTSPSFGVGFNTIIGEQAAYSAVTTYSNIIIGDWAGKSFSGNSSNIIIGSEAAELAKLAANINTGGISNIIIGTQAGRNISVPSGAMNYNIMMGVLAGNNASGGTHTIAIGYEAFKNGSGTDITVVGRLAGNRFKGNNNSAFGTQAGYHATLTLTGTDNVFIGSNAGYSSASISNTIVLATNWQGANASNKIYLGNTTQKVVLNAIPSTGATGQPFLVRNTTSGEIETRPFNKLDVVLVNSNRITTSTDQVLLVNTASSAMTITLRSNPVDGECITIKDRTGTAGNTGRNITINGNGKLIDGSGTAIINTNWGGVELVYSSGTNEWYSIGTII